LHTVVIALLFLVVSCPLAPLIINTAAGNRYRCVFFRAAPILRFKNLSKDFKYANAYLVLLEHLGQLLALAFEVLEPVLVGLECVD